MNSAKYVEQLIARLKAEAADVQRIAWETAMACVGWPYVYGAWGAECTVAERKKRYRDAHPTIRTACRAYDGGSCSGCKWYPDGERVRCFDCRGFTDWVLKVSGVTDLKGEGATSQWNTESNWDAKGTIDSMPRGVLCCLFVRKNGKMEHTGIGLDDATIECSNGVQYFAQRKAKWTHWAIPKGLSGQEPVHPEPQPDPQPTDPTLKRGSRGDAVKEMQTMLDKLGYDLGSSGADGIFGRMTESAVMNFQSDRRLTRDGICRAKTWDALRKAVESLRPVAEPLYTVHIPRLTAYQAEAVMLQYPGAYKTAEGG